METKDLNINGTIYAKYEIAGDIIFLHPIIKLAEDDQASEEIMCGLISIIEKTNFLQVAFLNI